MGKYKRRGAGNARYESEVQEVKELRWLHVQRGWDYVRICYGVGTCLNYYDCIILRDARIAFEYLDLRVVSGSGDRIHRQ